MACKLSRSQSNRFMSLPAAQQLSLPRAARQAAALRRFRGDMPPTPPRRLPRGAAPTGAAPTTARRDGRAAPRATAASEAAAPAPAAMAHGALERQGAARRGPKVGRPDTGGSSKTSAEFRETYHVAEGAPCCVIRAPGLKDAGVTSPTTDPQRVTSQLGLRTPVPRALGAEAVHCSPWEQAPLQVNNFHVSIYPRTSCPGSTSQRRSPCNRVRNWFCTAADTVLHRDGHAGQGSGRSGGRRAPPLSPRWPGGRRHGGQARAQPALALRRCTRHERGCSCRSSASALAPAGDPCRVHGASRGCRRVGTGRRDRGSPSEKASEKDQERGSCPQRGNPCSIVNAGHSIS